MTMTKEEWGKLFKKRLIEITGVSQKKAEDILRLIGYPDGLAYNNPNAADGFRTCPTAGELI